MNLYCGYFIPNALDPMGKEVIGSTYNGSGGPVDSYDALPGAAQAAIDDLMSGEVLPGIEKGWDKILEDKTKEKCPDGTAGSNGFWEDVTKDYNGSKALAEFEIHTNRWYWFNSYLITLNGDLTYKGTAKGKLWRVCCKDSAGVAKSVVYTKYKDSKVELKYDFSGRYRMRRDGSNVFNGPNFKDLGSAIIKTAIGMISL
jgi:hypothetical protein